MLVALAQNTDFNELFNIRKNSLEGYFSKRNLVWNEEAQQKKFKKDMGTGTPYTITHNKKTIGFVSIEDKADIINIAQMYISSDYQRQGIGSKTVDAIIKQFNNKKPLTLHTSIKNNEAQRFYKKNGFMEIDRNNDHVFYKKPIQGI